MNKYLLWLIILLGALNSCQPHGGYIITGELPNADGMTLVLMKHTPDSGSVRIDSSVVKKGKFMMKGLLEYPEYCALYAGAHGPLQFFAENTVIHIAIHPENIQESIVAGSAETELLMLFHAQTTGWEDSLRRVRTDSIKRFADEHPNSILTAFVVNNYLSHGLSAEEMEQYVAGFDTVNSQSPWVRAIAEKATIARRNVVGQPFTELRVLTQNDREIALSNYAGKDKYLLLYFWASWCEPCRLLNPKLVRLYNQYKEHGFDIIGISLDKNKNEWTRALRSDTLRWTQMSDLKFWQSEGAKVYSVQTIPHMVLLDKEGKILVQGIELDELENLIINLLK